MKQIFSAQFLRMELSAQPDWFINNFWTCRQICIILVSFERKTNTLYKWVKIKISWKVSMWLILEGRVTNVSLYSLLSIPQVRTSVSLFSLPFHTFCIKATYLQNAQKVKNESEGCLTSKHTKVQEQRLRLLRSSIQGLKGATEETHVNGAVVSSLHWKQQQWFKHNTILIQHIN